MIEELVEGRLKDVDGLVGDLRGGWGGAQVDYAEFFVGGAPIMTFTGCGGEDFFATYCWRRPLVVLIDEGTRSGKEVIACCLKLICSFSTTLRFQPPTGATKVYSDRIA